MRILFFGPATSPHATRWVSHLNRQGHEVTLATLHEIPPEETAYSVPLLKCLSKGPTSLRMIPEARASGRRLYREIQPDLTLAYYMTSYGFVAALCSPGPLVGAAAGGDVLVDDFDSWSKKMRNRLLVSWVLRRFDGMLAWAPHVADRLVELGFSRERTLVQPRGVDLNLFPYRQSRLRAADDPLRILSIRWLKPLYRVDTLVDALLRLGERGVPFEARIGGDGPERPRLERRVEEGGLGAKVRFLGKVAPPAIPEVLAWSDVYVSTSSTDGASSSLFEAMAVGTYPVVTKIAANSPFVREGETGDLFDVGDAESLARHLGDLAEDDERRIRGIESARVFVKEELDYAKNMSRIERFIEALARGGDCG